MNNTNDTQIKLQSVVPLRGSINLQSSPNVTVFLAACAFLLGSKASFKGTFTNGFIVDFCSKLKSFGFKVENTGDTLSIENFESSVGSNFFTSIDLSSGLLMCLLLSKKGSVEVINNSDLTNFYKYLGFLVDEEKNRHVILNRVEEARSNITFHSLNETYYYISILALLLNNKQFSISSVNLTYEQNLLIEKLKEIGAVKNVDYGNFVTVDFDFSKVGEKAFIDLVVPKDPKEFIFYSTASIATRGEVEINGLDPKSFASSLKIFSLVGGGFESLSDTCFKVWCPKNNILNGKIINDDSEYLNFTKLCLVPTIVTTNREEGAEIVVKIDTHKYKTFLQDMNMLGADLKLEEKAVISRKQSKLKSSKINLVEGEVESNYARLIMALLTKDLEINEIQHLLHYNDSVLSKLESLGVKLKDDFTN